MIKISEIVSQYVHEKLGIEREFATRYIDRVIDYYARKIAEAKSMVKTGVTLRQLLNKTNTFSKKHVPNCRIVSVEMNPRKGAPLIIAKIKCSESYSKGPHIVRISLSDKAIKSMNKKTVKLSCTCEAYQYWGAAYLADTNQYRYGPKNYNGKAPNPELETYKYRKRFFVCKHIVAFFREVFSQPNKMKTLMTKKKL